MKDEGTEVEREREVSAGGDGERKRERKGEFSTMRQPNQTCGQARAVGRDLADCCGRGFALIYHSATVRLIVSLDSLGLAAAQGWHSCMMVQIAGRGTMEWREWREGWKCICLHYLSPSEPDSERPSGLARVHDAVP